MRGLLWASIRQLGAGGGGGGGGAGKESNRLHLWLGM